VKLIKFNDHDGDHDWDRNSKL